MPETTKAPSEWMRPFRHFLCKHSVAPESDTPDITRIVCRCPKV